MMAKNLFNIMIKFHSFLNEKSNAEAKAKKEVIVP